LNRSWIAFSRAAVRCETLASACLAEGGGEIIGRAWPFPLGVCPFESEEPGSWYAVGGFDLSPVHAESSSALSTLCASSRSLLFTCLEAVILSLGGTGGAVVLPPNASTLGLFGVDPVDRVACEDRLLKALEKEDGLNRLDPGDAGVGV